MGVRTIGNTPSVWNESANNGNPLRTIAFLLALSSSSVIGASIFSDGSPRRGQEPRTREKVGEKVGGESERVERECARSGDLNSQGWGWSGDPHPGSLSLTRATAGMSRISQTPLALSHLRIWIGCRIALCRSSGLGCQINK